ncbi:hypothetical protein SEA_EYES_60 [Gordonia phage Eyes]|nr:hypothetical protein SEA_EYES_60 [Gordonia phage Eyes]
MSNQANTPPSVPGGSSAPSGASSSSVRVAALGMAVQWSGHRGSTTGNHPGTIAVLQAAEEFERYLSTGTVEGAES